jgi:hypothetical protein
MFTRAPATEGPIGARLGPPDWHSGDGDLMACVVLAPFTQVGVYQIFITQTGNNGFVNEIQATQDYVGMLVSVAVLTPNWSSRHAGYDETALACSLLVLVAVLEAGVPRSHPYGPYALAGAPLLQAGPVGVDAPGRDHGAAQDPDRPPGLQRVEQLPRLPQDRQADTPLHPE